MVGALVVALELKGLKRYSSVYVITYYKLFILHCKCMTILLEAVVRHTSSSQQSVQWSL
jgi:hypothetical protein